MLIGNIVKTYGSKTYQDGKNVAVYGTALYTLAKGLRI